MLSQPTSILGLIAPAELRAEAGRVAQQHWMVDSAVRAVSGQTARGSWKQSSPATARAPAG